MPCLNPFKSIVVRAVELVFACEEALRLIEEYEPPAEPRVEVPARAGTGQAVTEAPRGLLYHRYSIDAQGLILTAKIVPPTSQNQKRIEDDLVALRAAALGPARSRRSPGAANRRSATTTPASPAPPIS